MLTLGQLYQHYFPGEPYPDDHEELSPYIPLLDFLIYLVSQGYVFTDVYFTEGKHDPELVKSRPRRRDFEQLTAALIESRKFGHNRLYISEYNDWRDEANTNSGRYNFWEGSDPMGGYISVEPLISETINPLYTGRAELTIRGFGIKIIHYAGNQNDRPIYKTWKIYLDTQPTDSRSAAVLNALLRKYVPSKYIINYCYRMPTLDE